MSKKAELRYLAQGDLNLGKSDSKALFFALCHDAWKQIQMQQ